MKQGKLDETLKKHELWLEGAYGGEKADLSEAELRGAYLMGANLREADLRGADLSEAYLGEADLRRADLSEADLSGANLTRADIRRADLSGANLSGAKLNRVDLNSKNASDETKDELSKLIGFANKFHRVEECGEIKREELMK